MTAAELEQIADDFAKCAARVKDAGLDGCIIHAGHGKLLDQFRASDFNRRTDEFGGSVANRARFPLMVLRKIRDAVGPDFLLEYRTSVHEHEPGGIKLEESIEFFKILEAERLVDLFHVTAGRHFNPKSNAYCISPATFPAAPTASIASGSKRRDFHAAGHHQFLRRSRCGGRTDRVGHSGPGLPVPPVEFGGPLLSEKAPRGAAGAGGRLPALPRLL